MTLDQINTILDDEIFLTSAGIQCFRRMTDARAEEFRHNREALEADVDGCTRAEQWLSLVSPIKGMNHRRTSYSLKHIAERWAGDYVSNGALIVAAIHRGFRYMQPADNINVTFNISERSIKAATITYSERTANV